MGIEKRGTLGIVGLGRMGGGLAGQALEKGFEVVGFAPEGPPQSLVDRGLQSVGTLGELPGRLPAPRIVLVYVPAGPAIDDVVAALVPGLSPGDVVVDGGNSYWRDSKARAERLLREGIHLVDAGTSGGVSGAREGACFMVGGAESAVATVAPVLQALAVPGGWAHAGPSGAGHLAKLVHNGIEFGMLQAIGEGLALLEGSGKPLRIPDILSCWRHGTVIRGWLIELMEQGYREEGGLDRVPSWVEDTGEVSWLVEDALRLEIPIPVITQSVVELFASRDQRRTASRAVALMRRGFGGHPLGPDAAIARERATGRRIER